MHWAFLYFPNISNYKYSAHLSSHEKHFNWRNGGTEDLISQASLIASGNSLSLKFGVHRNLPDVALLAPLPLKASLELQHSSNLTVPGRTGPGGPGKSWGCHSLGSPGCAIVALSGSAIVGQPQGRDFRGATGPTQTSEGFLWMGLYIINKCLSWGFWKYSYLSSDYVRVGFTSVKRWERLRQLVSKEVSEYVFS